MPTVATEHFTDGELTAYISEALPLARSVAVEAALRTSPELLERLRGLLATYDVGPVSLGEIWRRRHVSCPSRITWQAYLADQIHGELHAYLQFHLEEIECRYCAANVADLQVNDTAAAQARVSKIFATSVGHLHGAGRPAHPK